MWQPMERSVVVCQRGCWEHCGGCVRQLGGVMLGLGVVWQPLEITWLIILVILLTSFPSSFLQGCRGDGLWHSHRSLLVLPVALSSVMTMREAAQVKMNKEKLAKLQEQVRIGGKGSARRKKKVVHRSSATDDKKLQNSLKKLTVNNISGIEEVNMIKEDGSVIHFNNPKVQASLNANTFAVSGHAESKQITEMLPGILNHLGAEGFNQLKRLASTVTTSNASAGGIDDDDDDVPMLVEDFEAASKTDTGGVEC